MVSLFVGNLHGVVDWISLKNYFNRAGNVKDIDYQRAKDMKIGDMVL